MGQSEPSENDGGHEAAENGELEALSFEAAIERLETIIERVESGEIGLEQALAEYERGTKLIAHCRSILDSAERRIAELTADESGGLRLEEGEAGEGNGAAS